MQGMVTSACNNINTAITDDGSSWAASDCETIQKDFAGSATMAAAVFTKVDDLAKGDSMTADQASTMFRVLTTQGTACDVRIEPCRFWSQIWEDF